MWAYTSTPCGSGLARDCISAVVQTDRSACIASNPAGTKSGAVANTPPFMPRAALKVALVLATELRSTLIAHPLRHLRHTQPFTQQQLLRPQQAQALKVLHRREQGAALEMLMKGGRAHIGATSQCFDI